MVLCARSAPDLEAACHDLQLRFGSDARAFAVDFAGGGREVTKVTMEALEGVERIDACIVCAGANRDDDDPVASPETIDFVQRVNFAGPACLLASLQGWAEKRSLPGLRYVMLSTIAAPVPRGSNSVYAAAKNALESYATSLAVRGGKRGDSVSVLRLGYVDTDLSFGMPLKLPVASPEQVARRIEKLLKHPCRLSYYPGWWRFIVVALRMLPWDAYRRLDF